MDMSLDDYINSFKEPSIEKQPNDESKFKEGRRDEDITEEEEELLLQDNDDYVSLALKNDDLALVKSTDQNQNDLRNKIVGLLPNSNSQQWRLMQPNVMHSRPAGMPPLIPSDMPHTSLSGNRGWRNYNHKYRNFFGRKNWNNNNNNFNNSNNRNNGRIQRFNNNTRANLNSKNIKIVLQQLKERNPMILYPEVGVPDLTIEASAIDKQNDTQNRPKLFSNFTMPTISPNLPQVSAGPQISTPTKGSEAIKCLLGISESGLRNDMIPSLAGKLLDFLNGDNTSLHRPQYDMKIQREIHDIQKKPLLYKCPGGEVVSSDGIGIPDCKIQPKASGVSLNNRFA